MPVSDATYEQVALEDPEHRWELACGRLREKPPVTWDHGLVGRRLIVRIGAQLDERRYSVGESARLRVSSGHYYVPDLCVVPVELLDRRRRAFPGALEVYDEPMPLVGEVWSPSTGNYDVEEKLREYQRRGDLEIWRIHPIERTLTAWRRQPDGSYRQSLYRDGIVEPATLPGVRIDLGTLFD